MKRLLTKKEAQETISSFFTKSSFTSEELRKIKRLANKYRLSLSQYKHSFCKKCLNPLQGIIRVTKTHKTIVCEKCGHRSRILFK